MQLVLSIPVGEVSEHEESQPVRRFFVKGLQYTWVVFLTTAALEQGFAFLAAVTAEIMVTFGDPVSQYQVKVQWLISVGECIARYASICPKIENVVTDTSTCLFLENLASLFLPPRLPFSTVTHQLLNLVVGHQFWPPRAMIPIQASLGCLAFQVQLNSFGVVSELLDTVHCRDLHSIRE